MSHLHLLVDNSNYYYLFDFANFFRRGQSKFQNDENSGHGKWTSNMTAIVIAEKYKNFVFLCNLMWNFEGGVGWMAKD
jgi:hypothetical protein